MTAVSQHEQYQDPDTEATKWNSAICYCIIIHASCFTTLTYTCVCRKKGLLTQNNLSKSKDTVLIYYLCKGETLKVSAVKSSFLES